MKGGGGRGLESSMARYVNPFRTLKRAQIKESEILQVSDSNIWGRKVVKTNTRE